MPEPARRAPSARALRIAFIAGVVAGTLSACGGDNASAAAGSLMVEESMQGDTTVLRVVSGSEWGAPAYLEPEVRIGVLDGDENYMFGSLASLAVADDGTIYAVDAQIPALRVYDAAGTHRGTWGRDGGGPGELAQPDGGLAVLPDGRVAVRDPGNARIQLYSPAGEEAGTWPVIQGGFNTSSPFGRGPAGELLAPVVVDLEVDVSDWKTGFKRISVQGEIMDTLVPPQGLYEPPTIEFRSENSVSINRVPFTADEHVRYHPEGYFIYGISERYAFTLLKPDGPIRIERSVDLPPVTAGERAEERARATRNMRRNDPTWRWNGPEIPDTKPAYEEIYVGEDGRIWIYRLGPGVEMEDPGYDPSDPDAVENRWRNSQLFDVYEADGTFLGTVEAPLDFGIYPTPVFRADQVWAVTRDEYEVQRIVRFRVYLDPET